MIRATTRQQLWLGQRICSNSALSPRTSHQARHVSVLRTQSPQQDSLVRRVQSREDNDTQNVKKSGKPAVKKGATPVAKKSGKAVGEKARKPVDSKLYEPRDLRSQRLKEIHPPRLQHNLDRVLFNPGVYYLQDPNSGYYNFDPLLETIPASTDFDFDAAVPPYRTPSQDDAWKSIDAGDQPIKFIGSTSTMTKLLQQMHFLISNARPINLSMISRGWEASGSHRPTPFQRTPVSAALRFKGNGKFAMDPDPLDEKKDSELMAVGNVLEKLLTSSIKEFNEYLKSTPDRNPPPIDKDTHAFNYTGFGPFLARSQLDSYDPRLGDTNTFDLKTRACLTIRMDTAERLEGARDYQIYKQHGEFGSFERELLDLARSMLFKYSLQARLGRMNGVFVAYHNLDRMFGFQYLTISQMDEIMHGTTQLSFGNKELQHSFAIMDPILTKITEHFGDQDIMVHFQTKHLAEAIKDGKATELYVFAEPLRPDMEDDLKAVQTSPIWKSQLQSRNTTKAGEEPTTPVLEDAAESEELIDDVLVSGETTLLREITDKAFIDADGVEKYLNSNKLQFPVKVDSKSPFVRFVASLAEAEEAVRRANDLEDLKQADTAFAQAILDVEELVSAHKEVVREFPAALRQQCEKFAAKIQPSADLGSTRDSAAAAAAQAVPHWINTHVPSDLLAFSVSVTNTYEDKEVFRVQTHYPVKTGKWQVCPQFHAIPQSRRLGLYRDMLKSKFMMRSVEQRENLYTSSYMRNLEREARRGGQVKQRFARKFGDAKNVYEPWLNSEKA